MKKQNPIGKHKTGALGTTITILTPVRHFNECNSDKFILQDVKQWELLCSLKILAQKT